jgi:hypothetical protein
VRLLFTLVLATLVADAMAENLPYQCRPERGCQEEKTATHDIGRGVILTLPEGWTYFSYPQAPIPAMAGLREIRAFKGGVVIAITPFPNIDKRETPEEWLRGLHAKGAGPYAPLSKENIVNFVSISHDDLIGGYASFTAKNDGERPFTVLAHSTFSSVTSFIISYRFVIFSVSVASEQPLDESYGEAIKAISNIK